MIISASFGELVSLNSDSMVYIPEGIHTISARVNGKPKQVTVRVKASEGEKLASKLQASLEKKMRLSPVKPFIDFDHEGKKASARPSRFFYEKGKGIMVERTLTGAGRKAIENDDYCYFSPTVRIDNSGRPSGIPMDGPLGGLVNNPAFTQIPSLEASMANPPIKTMNELIQCGVLTQEQADKDNASDIAKRTIEALKAEASRVDALKEKIKEMQAELADMMKNEAKRKEMNASKAVQQAVADGKILAKNEEGQTFWKEALIRDEDTAMKQIEAMSVINPDITNSVVNASQAGTKSESRQEKALIEAGKRIPNGSYEEKWSKAEEIDPEAFYVE